MLDYLIMSILFILTKDTAMNDELSAKVVGAAFKAQQPNRIDRSTK